MTCLVPFEEEDPSQHDHKGCEGEGEDYGIVADVHHVVDVGVIDPAPLEQKNRVRSREKRVLKQGSRRVGVQHGLGVPLLKHLTEPENEQVS